MWVNAKQSKALKVKETFSKVSLQNPKALPLAVAWGQRPQHRALNEFSIERIG